MISSQISVIRLENKMPESFEKLNCWQKAKELCLEVYKLLPNFPREEDFALKSQIRRAAISIPSNIAEGLSRKSIKDQINFLNVSIGSIYEVMTQIDISKDLQYIKLNERNSIFDTCNQVLKLINGYKNYLKKNEK